MVVQVIQNNWRQDYKLEIVFKQKPPLFSGADEQGIYSDLGPQRLRPAGPFKSTPCHFLATHNCGVQRACMHV